MMPDDPASGSPPSRSSARGRSASQPPPSRPTSPDDRSRGLRGASLGVELAAALIGFTLLGLWIDHHFGTSPWGLIACIVCGLIGGFYNFFRRSMSLLRGPNDDRRQL